QRLPPAAGRPRGGDPGDREGTYPPAGGAAQPTGPPQGRDRARPGYSGPLPPGLPGPRLRLALPAKARRRGATFSLERTVNGMCHHPTRALLVALALACVPGLRPAAWGDDTAPPEARVAVFSPDGKRLAVGTWSQEAPGQVTLFDVTKRQALWAH